MWYQSDFYATFGVGAGSGLNVARTSPDNAFPSITELAFTVGAPAHWMGPYALVAVELQGQLGQGRPQPGHYYEGLREDDRFGFFGVGGLATVPRSGGSGAFGHWQQVVVSGGLGVRS